MTRTKLDTPAFADQSVDTRTILDGTIQNQDISGSLTNAKLANSSISVNGTSVSLGGSTSVTPFLDWQAVTVADGSTTLTAEAGKGYFLDTNTGVIEVFLPTSPSRGDTIGLVDYGGTFATNKLIINTGGKLIDSTTGPDFKVETNNAIVELVYIDDNKGWQVILNQAAGTTPDNALDTGGGYDTTTFIQATGGTITTSGNFKIHTFTGDGCFVVSSIGNPAGGPNNVDYLVVAGGGAGGTPGGNSSGGGGAGGLRFFLSPDVTGCYPAKPRIGPAGVPVTAATFPITVGGGSAAKSHPQPNPGTLRGSNSVFSTITSTGGGDGGHNPGGGGPGNSGGSGGGGSGGGLNKTGGAGNTPPVSPSQGSAGGARGSPGPDGGGGGGGGFMAAGTAANTGTNVAGGVGGGFPTAFGSNGVPSGCFQYFSGGGQAGGNTPSSTQTAALGGGGTTGGPATGPEPARVGVAGTANSGGGGGGTNNATGGSGGAGGKGIVVLRYKFQ